MQRRSTLQRVFALRGMNASSSAPTRGSEQRWHCRTGQRCVCHRRSVRRTRDHEEAGTSTSDHADEHRQRVVADVAGLRLRAAPARAPRNAAPTPLTMPSMTATSNHRPEPRRTPSRPRTTSASQQRVVAVRGSSTSRRSGSSARAATAASRVHGPRRTAIRSAGPPPAERRSARGAESAGRATRLARRPTAGSRNARRSVALRCGDGPPCAAQTAAARPRAPPARSAAPSSTSRRLVHIVRMAMRRPWSCA